MRALTLALVVCLSFVMSPFAQTETGTLTGRVIDASGAPLPGASVRIVGTPRITVTDAKGEFRFEGVPAGNYEIAVSLAGFISATRTAIVRTGSTAAVTVTLAIGALTETVTVQSSSDRSARGVRAPAPPPGAAGGLVGGTAGGVIGGVVHGLPGPLGQHNTEAYSRINDNTFRFVQQEPLSTFSVDVDTASYSNVRRFLNTGAMPPPDAVRTEELMNYFRFDYPDPRDGEPFSVTTEIAACPWNKTRKLALVGIQARRVDAENAPPRNLVLLIDVSGSMMSPDKLPLVRTALRMLVDTLNGRDRVAIVVYAGASGVVLPATPGDQKERIHQAIAQLEAGGSTNGGEGIKLAYTIAQEGFIKGGINRVILATDGDFNVGVTSEGELVRLIEQKREAGVFLSILGVGTGNLKDSTMEALADKGNGNYAYLDSLHEARKVLVAEAGSTLVTVAKDVKIQIEFNPAHVTAYRLIGYENRLLRHDEFNDDKKDAGEIGAGHTVTALYEVVPPGARLDLPGVDPLKYQAPAQPLADATGELMTVKLRYKQPDGETSRLIAVTVKNGDGPVTDNVGFASAVAAFGMLLRKSEHRGTATYADTIALARRHRGRDESGYRAEFIRLVELADALSRQARRR
jgi:Ca-activated chloride channel homolog